MHPIDGRAGLLYLDGAYVVVEAEVLLLIVLDALGGLLDARCLFFLAHRAVLELVGEGDREKIGLDPRNLTIFHRDFPGDIIRVDRRTCTLVYRQAHLHALAITREAIEAKCSTTA